MPISSERFTLRDLPAPARVVLAGFLVAVALGHVAALVQLHLEQTTSGDWLPGPAEIAKRYALAEKPVSQIERLLVSTSGELNGMGSMRPAFFEKSRRWQALVKQQTPEGLRRLILEREGECLALLSWIRAGANRQAYDHDDYFLPVELSGRAISEEFLVQDADEKKPAGPRRLRLRTLIEHRCVDCHSPDGRNDLARSFPLDSYERLQRYCQAPASSLMTVEKLAEATQMHLLAFGLVYGATGLAYCFTRYSLAARTLFGPGPLMLQVATVACWWLGRIHPAFAYAVFYTGLAAGTGLAIQVIGCLWDLFARKTKDPEAA